jgi:hypothetical protein
LHMHLWSPVSIAYMNLVGHCIYLHSMCGLQLQSMIDFDCLQPLCCFLHSRVAPGLMVQKPISDSKSWSTSPDVVQDVCWTKCCVIALCCFLWASETKGVVNQQESWESSKIHLFECTSTTFSFTSYLWQFYFAWVLDSLSVLTPVI